MAEIKNLQEFINKRAEEYLDKDIAALGKWVRDCPILGEGSGFPHVFLKFTDKPEAQQFVRTSIVDLFYYSYEYCRRLKAYWLPKYIERESKLFLEKVDEIKEDVDNLLNNQNY